MRTPPGFATVTPYLFADACADYCDWLVVALGAERVGRHLRPDGGVGNAQLRFGETIIMLSDPADAYPACHTSLYLYVEDADVAMARAVAAGAECVMAVADQPYGDRQGGIRDPRGNLWWLSQRLVDAPYF